ncbi:unnamed protein product [Strongylus vulgaris]|uniref:Uncharacterized protein n=1 Tax=Strongylus vulgaris TaxID=40348 RepID=A0A3P7IWX5_STRVU|nr:unnamed protein product [Strongylus vulgaris]
MTFYTGAGRRGGYVPGRDPMVDEVMRGWQQRWDSPSLFFWSA